MIGGLISNDDYKQKHFILKCFFFKKKYVKPTLSNSLFQLVIALIAKTHNSSVC